MMKVINAIAINTFKESIRNKIIYNIFIFSIFIFILSSIIGGWSLGEQLKVITDFGLTSLHLISLLIAIFVGISLVSREIDNRTIYNTLSKNVRRWQFLIGKLFGLALTLFLNIFLIGTILMLILYIYSGHMDFTIYLPVLFIYFEMVIIVALSIFFSSFTNATLSAIYTIFIYITGHLLQSVINYLGRISESNLEGGLGILKNIVEILVWILPNLSLFNISEEFVYQTPISGEYIILIILYTLFYLGFLILISSFIFHKKDLK